jgi:hypothetical protein
MGERAFRLQHVSHQRSEHAWYPRLFAKLARRLAYHPVPAKAFVFENCEHIFVTRDQPSILFVRKDCPADGCFGAKTGVEGERVGLELRTRDVHEWN